MECEFSLVFKDKESYSISRVNLVKIEINVLVVYRFLNICGNEHIMITQINGGKCGYDYFEKLLIALQNEIFQHKHLSQNVLQDITDKCVMEVNTAFEGV